jgi:pSer/pThr/pTyr-binding forkhead associated (FHA) protein
VHDLDLVDAPMVLGRGAASMSDPRLFRDHTVSTQHASMRQEGGAVVLEDANSRNGTFVNGVPAHGARLRVGDTIALGALQVAVDAIVFDAELPTIVVETLRGDEAGVRLTFCKAVVTFGRAPTNDVFIDDPHGFVSRRHAELAVTPAGLVLRDLGSSNGTFVNGARVQQTTLRPGATVSFPPSFFAFRVSWSADPAAGHPAVAGAHLAAELEAAMAALRTSMWALAVDNPVWRAVHDERAANGGVDLAWLAGALAAHIDAAARTFADAFAPFGRAVAALLPAHHPALQALHGRAASIASSASAIAELLRHAYRAFDAGIAELRGGRPARARELVADASRAAAAAIAPLVEQAAADFVTVCRDALEAAA